MANAPQQADIEEDEVEDLLAFLRDDEDNEGAPTDDEKSGEGQ